MLLPCSLRALCPSSPPCRVAVATIAAPRYPARGFVGAIPLPHPRERREGERKGQPPASALSAPPLCALSARAAPQGASHFDVRSLLFPCSSLARCLLFTCYSIARSLLAACALPSVPTPLRTRTARLLAVLSLCAGGCSRWAIPLPHPERPQRGVRKGQPTTSALSAPLSAASLPVQPPRGLPILMFAAYSLLARHFLAACSILVFEHFLDFTKMICYATVIIDLRIFTFCPKIQIFLNKLCLSNWLKIAG